MRRTPLVAAIALSLSPLTVVVAQNAPNDSFDDSRGTTAIPVTYNGPNTRVSLGIDDDANVLGEILAVFGKKDDSAWLFEGWLGHGGEGGLKLDYHWVWGRGGDKSSAATVAKVFGAIDQNAWDDRKATLGMGFERNDVFLDLYASGALTDERLVGTGIDTSVRTITGVDGGRPFEQLETTVVTTRSFEHPYDWGIGARAGRHFDSSLVRIRGGLDYEKGDYGSDQFTLSLGLDKYIRNTGHAISVELEHYERDGDFETDDNDTRAWLFWRYDFGSTFAPAPGAYREVQQPREVTVEVPGEPVVVRNEVGMDSEAFFELDSAVLKSSAQASLEELVAVIKSDARISRVAVVGSTCDLGSDAYNQRLSEKRAAAVRDFFESRGVATTELDVSGVGESKPKYPNDGEENRRKNRRVDVSFLTVEEVEKPGTTTTETRTEMEWVKEPIDAPPAFIERALRNPSEHKRTVDVYRFDDVDTDVSLGTKTFLNRPPQAVNDAVPGVCSVSLVAPVLANDSDPDGDVLSVISVASGTNGVVPTLLGNGTVSYTVTEGSSICSAGGVATFSYTIADPSGATSTASVNVTVAADPVDARDDVASTAANVPVTVDVLANDLFTRPASVFQIATGPANGTAVIGGDGRITYTPRPGFVGIDTVVYRVANGRGLTDTATLTITVTASNTNNRPPVAINDSLATLQGVDTLIDVLLNDSDPDGDLLTIVSTSTPANGRATIVNNRIVYISDAGFCGEDTFTYTIRDTAGNTATATVTVNVLD